jgi:hypothetical protein
MQAIAKRTNGQTERVHTLEKENLFLKLKLAEAVQAEMALKQQLQEQAAALTTVTLRCRKLHNEVHFMLYQQRLLHIRVFNNSMIQLISW